MTVHGENIDPTPLIAIHFERVSLSACKAAADLSAATLHESAGQLGALPAAIKPIHPHFRLCGSAVTVTSPGGDNLWIHRAIYAAQPGDVLVVDVRGKYDHGYWGEIMSTAANQRNLAGLVIDGCVRDAKLLDQIGFSVFARGVCLRGTQKDFGAAGQINAPICIGDVIINPGDLVVGDLDGVVCIPRARVGDTIIAARRRETQEAHALPRLQGGESTLQIFGWSR